MSKKTGPKPQYGVIAEKVVGVRLTPTLYAELKKQATKSDATSISDYTRKIVVKDINEKSNDK